MKDATTKLLLGLGLLATTSLQLQAEPLSVATVRQAVDDYATRAVSFYREFLSLPNDANDEQDIERLVSYLEARFGELRFATQRLSTSANPVLYAERIVDADAPTVLVYLQADGQPVDPSAWDQDDPFDPVLKAQNEAGEWQAIPWSSTDQGLNPDWRIFARSAADSKGPMTQFMVAMRLLEQLDAAPDYNLKVVIDTEEEMGSPRLAGVVEKHRDLLAADMLLIFDGPPHSSNLPTVYFGARGIATVTLTTYGPVNPQHSGHYGNFVPNPAFQLARILASMKSADGRVLIDGFYDGIEISDEVKALLQAVPDDEAKILADMGLSTADQVAESLQLSIQYPSLNIRGMNSAWVGDQARTIIPATATAEIDMRLVVESDPEYLISQVQSHIASLGYLVLDRAPTEQERLSGKLVVSMQSQVSYAAFRSDFDSAPGLMARTGLRRLYGEEPILIRNLGGSIPISPFVDALGIPAAAVPTVNIDNNQHSPNENLRLGNFLEGIVMLMSVLSTSPE